MGFLKNFEETGLSATHRERERERELQKKKINIDKENEVKCESENIEDNIKKNKK